MTPSVDLDAGKAEDILRYAVDQFGDRLIQAISFQKEASVILDMLMKINPKQRFFTIDNGNLFPETLEVWQQIEDFGEMIGASGEDQAHRSRQAVAWMWSEVNDELRASLAGNAAVTVGACHRILDLVLEHIKARKQFGVPIGSFQAVKHHLADVRIAMGFSGQTWFELIQPLDDQPSVYRETIQARGYGLHHHGIAVSDVEAALADYAARGWKECFRSPVPTGGDVVYLEGDCAGAGIFLELLPVTPGMDAHFTSFWKAAQDWDGTDPIRPFI